MENTSALGLISELKQSRLLGNNYEHILDFKGSNPVLDYFIKDIRSLYNKILLQCNSITKYQRDTLDGIFNEFIKIQYIIDPVRLRSFEYAFNDDEELVLFRNTDKGLTNIIINPDECFAFSFIPKDARIKKTLNFYYEHNTDFEKLAYNFFS